MNTSQIFDPVSLFYSYSHADESIRAQIEKHLTTLKRLGLIETWHDRRIGPGDEWKKEIDQKLREADIILLLLSPDFIASEYCYNVESKCALERHKRDEATVIPVMLRPVDIHGLPFADLQMLPKNGKPISIRSIDDPRSIITSIDDALREVAEGIRSVVENIIDRRLRRLPPANRPGSLLEGRVIEAAVAQEISVGEFRDVVVLVRLAHSDGLLRVLSPDSKSSYSCIPTDVRFQTFDARYSVTATHELISPEYHLTISAPSLVFEQEEKRFPLQPMRDSSSFTFLVKAETAGEHRLRVDLYCRDWNVAEVLLKTSAAGSKPGPGGAARTTDLMASVELVLRAIAKAATA